MDHYINEYLTRMMHGGDQITEAEKLILYIYFLSGACKKPRFREEQEIRLMVMEPRDPKIFHDKYKQGISKRFYRSSEKYNKISYFTLPFLEHALTSIYLGPKNAAKNDDSNLKIFLAENGYNVN